MASLICGDGEGVWESVFACSQHACMGWLPERNECQRNDVRNGKGLWMDAMRMDGACAGLLHFACAFFHLRIGAFNQRSTTGPRARASRVNIKVFLLSLMSLCRPSLPVRLIIRLHFTFGFNPFSIPHVISRRDRDADVIGPRLLATSNKQTTSSNPQRPKTCNRPNSQKYKQKYTNQSQLALSCIYISALLLYRKKQFNNSQSYPVRPSIRRPTSFIIPAEYNRKKQSKSHFLFIPLLSPLLSFTRRVCMSPSLSVNLI